MNKLFLIATCCFCITVAKAQIVSNINFDQIKHHLSAPGNPYHSLMSRWLKTDTTLSPENYRDLYYGQVFQPGYTAFDENPALLAAQTLINNGDLVSAKKAIDDYLEANPLSLGGIYTKMVLLKRSGRAMEFSNLTTLYKGLISAILQSGDGKTGQTAYVVVYVPDEYKLLPALGVKSISHRVADAVFDVQQVMQRDGSLTEIYFNLSKPISQMGK